MSQKCIRRFDPRRGVSQQMLEAEAVYLEQELGDYLLRSVNELREMLKERQVKITATEANVQLMLSRLPDRHRLAIRAMLARDFYHIAALYELLLNSSAELREVTGRKETRPEEVTAEGEAIPAVPFVEWLFEPEEGDG